MKQQQKQKLLCDDSHCSIEQLAVARQLLLAVRGGAVAIATDTLSDDESDGSISPLVEKIRNVLRSLFEIGDRKSPSITKILRIVLQKLETLTGIKLLPPTDTTIKKKKKMKSSKKAKASKNSTKSGQVKSVDAQKSKESESKSLKTTKSSLSTNQAAKKHISSKISTTNPNYRIQRELKEFIKSPPPNLTVKVGSNIRVWIITMTGATNTIYEGETYKLRVQFPKDYPIVPPSVYFLAPTPQHEHVYTNGDICLSLLGKDWRPTMTAQSIAVSILSILSSAQSKSIPMDNARHSQNKPGQYQKDWVYHDDNC